MPSILNKRAEKASPDEALERLRTSGHRLTPARRLIVECLATNSRPLSAQELIDWLASKEVQVNKTTVYRELDFLEEQGIVRELDFLEGKKRYEYIRDEAHHHLVCRRCERIRCIELPDEFEAFQSKIRRKYDFDIYGHIFEFFGICKDCR